EAGGCCNSPAPAATPDRVRFGVCCSRARLRCWSDRSCARTSGLLSEVDLHRRVLAQLVDQLLRDAGLLLRGELLFELRLDFLERRHLLAVLAGLLLL